MQSHREEAELIVDILFEEYGSIGVIPPCLPPVQDGKEAIKWLKEKNLPFGEVEWTGFFIKHYTRFLLDQKVPKMFEHYTPRPKRHLIRGKYVWDIRMKSTASRSTSVILTDTNKLDEFLEKHNGLGLLLVVAYAEEDNDGSFLEWHENFKGGTTEYTRTREAEERPIKVRKKDFMIVHISAFYFTKEDFQAGIEEGWVDPSFQITMRNYDGKPRNPKYIIDIARIPTNRGYLFTRNFNYDPNDFADDFLEE